MCVCVCARACVCVCKVSPNYKGRKFMCGPQDLKILSLDPRRNRSWSSLLHVLNLTTSTEESRVLNERPVVRSARGETLRLLQNTKAHCRVHKSSPPALSWARWIQSPPRPCFNSDRHLACRETDSARQRAASLSGWLPHESTWRLMRRTVQTSTAFVCANH
jgi:hypothetical protein